MYDRIHTVSLIFALFHSFPCKNELNVLINKMAQVILSENKQYVGEKVAEAAIKEIQEGGNENETKVKKSTRGRKKQYQHLLTP